MKQRLAIVLSATALAVAALGSTPIGHASQAEQYVPFVTDFPKPVSAPAAKESSSGIDWGEVGIAGGVAAVLAALLAGSGLVLTRRARPARG